MHTDLIDFALLPLCNVVDTKFYLAKIENDPILGVLIDNYQVFNTDMVYPYLVDWVYFNYKLIFDQCITMFKMIREDKDRYTKQILYLLAPTIHIKFFHAHFINHSTPYHIMEKAFSLLELPPETAVLLLKNIKTPYIDKGMVW